MKEPACFRTNATVPAPSPMFRRSEALGNQITELCGYINAATYRLLDMIRQFDQEGLWEPDGVCSCAHWLNWKCGIGMNAAREKVRVANALGELPKISACYSRGEISYSKVRAMTRVATVDNEDYLLMIAKHGTAYHMETLVRKYRRVTRLNEDDAEKQHDNRAFRISHEDDGTIVLHARLPAETGALVLKAIERALDQNTQDVSAETSPEPDVVERDSFEQRRADALIDIAESYLANGPAASSGDRYQVMLHVSAETLAEEEEPAFCRDNTSYIEDGSHVSAETARRLCCDAAISVLKQDGDGELLNIGRKSRIIPPAMRRALRSRDEGCRFPGCTHQHAIDGHHIAHWSQGGETRLGNLVQLCRHHHRLVHEGGFTCTKNTAGRVEFHDRNGRRIESSGKLPAVRPSIDITEQMRDRYEDLFINANTCVSHYSSGGIDWDMTISGLIN